MARPTTVVRSTAVGFGVVYTAILVAAGVQLQPPYRQFVTFAPLVATVLLAAWDTWAWRGPLLHRLTARPRLHGLWAATLHPTPQSAIPEGGNPGPIPAYLVIQQTYWSVTIRQYTGESTSNSRSFFWEQRPGAESETLAFIYENTPEQVHEHRSQRHLGTCTLEPTSRAPTTMRGAYVTDRYTKGDMVLTLVDRSKSHASYDEARRHAERSHRKRR